MRISTRLDNPISVEVMKILTDNIIKHNIWGLNMGETECTEDAWDLLVNELPNSLVGFMWQTQRNTIFFKKYYCH